MLVIVGVPVVEDPGDLLLRLRVDGADAAAGLAGDEEEVGGVEPVLQGGIDLSVAEPVDGVAAGVAATGGFGERAAVRRERFTINSAEGIRLSQRPVTRDG